jgi:hypothetical protein
VLDDCSGGDLYGYVLKHRPLDEPTAALVQLAIDVSRRSAARLYERTNWTCFGKTEILFGRKRKSSPKEVAPCKHPFTFYIIQMRVILLTRKKIIIILWPNRDDDNHILIIAIDMDSQMDERSGRTLFFDPSTNGEVLDLSLFCSLTVAVI